MSSSQSRTKRGKRVGNVIFRQKQKHRGGPEDAGRPGKLCPGHTRPEHLGKQKQIARSVAANLRTVVKACHASGKTYIAAAIVLWWITYHREAIAVTTAPTWNQVRRLMWGEIQRLAYHAKISYPNPRRRHSDSGPVVMRSDFRATKEVGFRAFTEKMCSLCSMRRLAYCPRFMKRLTQFVLGGTYGSSHWGIL